MIYSNYSIVNDTIREICVCNKKDLKKPLKVKFFGEEAEDAGGVRKEVIDGLTFLHEKHL